MDFSPLTSAVNFSTVAAAFMAVAALKVVPIAAAWGIRKVLSMIGR